MDVYFFDHFNLEQQKKSLSLVWPAVYAVSILNFTFLPAFKKGENTL